MFLKLHDFWPPWQGGWEQICGKLVSVDFVITHFERCLGEPLLNNEVSAHLLDEFDLHDFLDGVCIKLSVPTPVRVIWIAERNANIKGIPNLLLPGFYAVWHLEDWTKTPFLYELILPTEVEVDSFWHKTRRYIPVGADAMLWLVLFLTALYLSHIYK
jgi:hypothetical protein